MKKENDTRNLKWMLLFLIPLFLLALAPYLEGNDYAPETVLAKKYPYGEWACPRCGNINWNGTYYCGVCGDERP